MSITGERYQLLERIGHGGMAVVHRAHDAVLERTVALKVLHPHLAERADSRARFAREAKAVARLKHPNIVEVFDYASASSDKSFIVTEFVDGPTLRDFAELSPPRFAESALLLILPVVEAIAKAHEAGIIHRDVKPEKHNASQGRVTRADGLRDRADGRHADLDSNGHNAGVACTHGT